MHGLSFDAARAPRRKLRGKRAYFERVRRRANGLVIAPGPGQWWDLWHYHADWCGWGNRGWRWREPHLRALCRVFARIAASEAAFTTPFQIWILLDGSDAGQDATFLHTPNPNAANFPLAAQGIDWSGSPLVSYFKAQLAGDVRVGVSRREDEPGATQADRLLHWVSVAGVGLPIV
ncbi:MAG: hypothetical protein H6718_28790 [Polyangiaceae bacterium]|nr:hypothetical protein [Myxococcales bacterium]MCB9589445.1 hypothetical protein [Polyangiaceae bacterium]